MSHDPDVTEALNDLVERFTRDWDQGRQPDIGDYLSRAEPASRAALFVRLLRVELLRRAGSGETPPAEEYRRRFPDQAAQVQAAFSDFADTRMLETNSFCSAIETPRVAGPPRAIDERFGRFELREVLGQGGFGTVYRAYDPRLDREIALKVPRRDVRWDEREVQQFLQEAQAAARLTHPHIVPVYEVGEEAGTPYIACGLVAGRTLRNKLSQARRLSPWDAAKLVKKIALALHYAHQRGVIHRDVKPENVLLDEDGEPHLSDFGLARRVESDAQPGALGAHVGTPAYMSPEQARGESGLADARSDLWALGVVLYELLTGRRPFAGDLRALLRSVLEDEPPPPRSIVTSIPRDLESVCLKCLAKDPDERYPSCQHLAEDLERYANMEPVAVRNISAPARAWRWCRRKPLAATLTALSVALAMLLVGGWYTVAVRERIERAERAYLQGRSEAQHGRWDAAVAQYNLALENGHASPVRVRLALVEALRSQGDLAGWSQEIAGLMDAAEPGDYEGEIMLWQGERLRYQGRVDDALAATRESLTLGLIPAQDSYARALLSESTPEALTHLRRAVELDATHHSARSMLVATLVASGWRAEARQHIEIGRTLFAGEPTYPVWHAVVDALEGRTDEVERLSISLPAQQRDLLQPLLDGMVQIIEMIRRWDEREHNVISFAAQAPSAVALVMRCYSAVAAIREQTQSTPERDGAIDLAGSVALSLPPSLRRAFVPLSRTLPLALLPGARTATINDLTHAVQSHPEASLHFARANLLLLEGKKREAEDAFLAASLAPSILPEINRLSAYVAAVDKWDRYLDGGETDRKLVAEAANLIRRCQSERPLPGWYGENAVMIAVDAMDFDLARRIVLAGEHAAPSSVRWMQLHMEVEFMAENFVQAHRLAEVILSHDPKNKQATVLRQWSLDNLQEYVTQHPLPAGSVDFGSPPSREPVYAPPSSCGG